MTMADCAPATLRLTPVRSEVNRLIPPMLSESAYSRPSPPALLYSSRRAPVSWCCVFCGLTSVALADAAAPHFTARMRSAQPSSALLQA